MKFKILMTIAAVALFGSTTVWCQNYSAEFGSIMDMDRRDQHKPQLDSILSLWGKSAPDDPKLAIAKCRRLLLDCYKPVITKAKNKNAGNDSTYNIVIDHELDPVVINKAYSIIDGAINNNPDIFELRQYKLITDYQLEFYSEFIRDFEKAFKRQEQNKGKWIVDDSFSPEVPRERIFTALAVGYLNDIISKDSIDLDLAEQLLDTGLKYFPNEFRLLNIYGIIVGNYRHDAEAAAKYYSKALEIAPDDVLILLNFAQLKVKTGDAKGAIELASKVLESPEASKDYKDEAMDIISYANAEKIPVSLYSFEFQYAPVLASKAGNPFQMTNVAYIIEEDLPSGGFIPQFRSDVVKDDLITIGDKECVLWTFDDPTETPLCKYLVFIPADKGFDVYTLEKTLPLDENINWVIGHPTTEGPSSLGGVKGFENGEAFVKFVIDKIVK